MSALRNSESASRLASLERLWAIRTSGAGDSANPDQSGGIPSRSCLAALPRRHAADNQSDVPATWAALFTAARAIHNANTFAKAAPSELTVCRSPPRCASERIEFKRPQATARHAGTA